MKKILISIKNDSLVFAYRTSLPKSQGNLLNTNIISDNELVFSDEYLSNNIKIVSLFLKELCVEKQIHAVTVSNNELAFLILKLLKKNDYVTSFYIKENANLTFAICEELISCKYIKKLNVFSIQTFMLEMLDNHDIMVESRNETFVVSNFMLENNLQQFSKIYYKSSLRFTIPLSKDDLDDFEAFCKINRYLKNIHISQFDNYDLDNIITIIKNNKLKNLKIYIHDDNNNVENIEFLKKLNKKFKSKYKIEFKLKYSDEYLKENIFKQIMLNTLKICGLIITTLVIGIISYVSYTNYKAMKDLTKIQNNINDIIEDAKEENIEPPEENIDNNIENTENTSNNTIINKDLTALFEINTDVYGWLKVNNTNIDYPVVKSEDNSYYLKHNLYKENDKNGWIFMDYRNSKTSELSKNTIIYGHNMYYSGVMFGTLTNAYKKSWYTNKDNQIITFNTLYKNMKFQIFSIYKIPKTSDYLYTSFDSDDEFQEFVSMIKGRSIYDFNIDINNDDNILTLSTCTGNNARLVVHAKLIKE